MNHDHGTTVVISSHNLNFVSDISTRILLLEKGHVIKDLPNNQGSATQELNDYFNAEAEQRDNRYCYQVTGKTTFSVMLRPGLNMPRRPVMLFTSVYFSRLKWFWYAVFSKFSPMI